MFKSKKRSITIPQSEHARLSGLLAYLWGNSEVAVPPVDRISFASGVTQHDRGYGLLDSMAIGEVDAAIWLATQRRGIELVCADPTADTVALLHIQRLLAFSDTDEARQLENVAEELIKSNIPQTSHTREDFQRADSITRLCDEISFKFCFEDRGELNQTIYSEDDLLPIRVVFSEAGHIQIHPWPLSVPELRGFVLGYERSGYPDHLEPVMVEFTFTPQNE